MDSLASTSQNPVQFLGASFSAGVLWMTCATAHTKEWLSATIGRLKNFLEGVELQAIEAKDLAKRPKVIGWFPDQAEEERVRIRLKAQNPDLKTEDWHLLSRKTEEKGQTLAYSLDAASFKALEKAGFRVYYQLGRVTLKQLNPGNREKTKDEGGADKPAPQ